MKSLYDEEGRVTKDCTDFYNSVAGALRPIFKEWCDKGFSFRDLSSEVMAVGYDLELEKAFLATYPEKE